MRKLQCNSNRNCGRVLFFLSTVAMTSVFVPQGSKGAEKYGVTVERNVGAKMRDGVTLRADIYRPNTDGKYPVLLVRTPYDRRNETNFGMKGAARGYVVIAQDVRGRFESEGEWYTFKNESQDGYDTVEWAAALPYSNGKVGMFGGSYVGATQFLAAIAHPPHLAGICPTVTASNYHDGWTYQGGAFEQWFNESWSSGLAENTMRRRAEQKYDALGGTKVLPLISYPVLEPPSGEGIAPYFRDWLLHPSYDEYWKQWSIEDHYGQIQVPVRSIAAWYDIFLGGSLKNYVRLKTDGGTEAARKGQRLVVTVGGHAGQSSSGKVGAVEFGEKLTTDSDEQTLRWYDWVLKGEANGVENEKPVKIFVMGKNEWREEDEWPLARAKATRYYLHSTGAANGVTGNGTLSTVAPAEEKADQYVYDPSDAVPTIGGPLCCGALPTGIGPQDQRPAEGRSDVLVYTTPAFAKDTEVTGPVSLDLYVNSSAVDTDFTGMLVDVWPNGFAQNLTSGILRLRYRNSQEKPELANPGETYHITVDLWATSNVFLAGHKLRLEVSSSNFPRFDRNMNTGEEQARATRMVKATNMLYHDKAHPSALIVPLVP
ncbi:MAG TPA: CocE/NonD family hydrolase [Candidatus Angelobacter sp.]|nr:CocE/NonD family hydrolase [Candidatus Angelobacter sp.]